MLLAVLALLPVSQVPAARIARVSDTEGLFEHLDDEHNEAEVQGELQQGDDNCPPFPANLGRSFASPRVAGTGATACVFLAQKKSVTFAIKVSKTDGKYSALKRECDEMQDLRKAACSEGAKFLKLSEQYLPTCVEVGEDAPGRKAFLVMHAAGTLGIGKSERKTKNIGFDVPTQKSAFAQLVAAVYTMHKLGFAHNDLHGNNVVFDKAHRLALIDFGDVTPLQMAHTGAGLKRDANAVWRWGASLAGCSDFTYKYLKSPKSRRAPKRDELLACVRAAWDLDDESFKVYGDILDTSAARTPNQDIAELFVTPFVQKHLPKPTQLFVWEETKDCLSWDWSKMKKPWEIQECRSMPSYAGQCGIAVHPGGCFAPEAGADWSCFAPGNSRSPAACRARGYAGACLHTEHGKMLTSASVPECGQKCVDKCTEKGRADMWGACFVSENVIGIPAKNQCRCVETAANGGAPLSFLKRQCSTEQIPTLPRTYEGLCKLPGKEWVEPQVTPQRRASYVPVERAQLATTTTTAPDRSLLDTSACQCQDSEVINGKPLQGKVGCGYHLTRRFGKFCFISGGEECAGAKLSKKTGLWWRRCSK